MGNVSAAVAEGVRRATEATAAIATRDRPASRPTPTSPGVSVSILSRLAGLARTFCSLVDGSRAYMLPGVRRPRLLCRRRWL